MAETVSCVEKEAGMPHSSEQMLQRTRETIVQAKETIRRSREILRVSRAVQSDRERAEQRKQNKEGLK
jgi:hypothetical protein